MTTFGMILPAVSHLPFLYPFAMFTSMPHCFVYFCVPFCFVYLFAILFCLLPCHVVMLLESPFLCEAMQFVCLGFLGFSILASCLTNNAKDIKMTNVVLNVLLITIGTQDSLELHVDATGYFVFEGMDRGP